MLAAFQLGIENAVQRITSKVRGFYTMNIMV